MGIKMWQMIVFELKKLFQKKIVYAGIIGIAVFNLLLFQGWGVWSERVLTTEGETLTGAEAVKYNHAFGEKYKGELTDELVQELFAVYPEEMKYNSYLVDMVDYVYQQFGEEDGEGRKYSGLSVDEVFSPEMGKIQIGNSRGIASALFYMMNIMVIVGIIIVIAVAPVFSEEYTRGTDALILTSKYGKTRCARAKIIASFLFSISYVVVILAGNTVLHLVTQGAFGWDTSVQTDAMGMFDSIPYEMNLAQLSGYAIILWMVSSVLLTGMVLLISAFSKSSFVGVIIAMACYVVPVWINNLLPVFIKVMMPANQMATISICEIVPLQLPGYQVMWVWPVVLASAVLAVLCSFYAKRGFEKHQITG